MSVPTLRSVASLVAAGMVPADATPALSRVAARYAVAITPTVAALIDPRDPADPIARQFVPDIAELDARPEDRADPIGDAVHSPVPGIVHRYPDRVLLKIVQVCPVYCRFCFRREAVGPGPDALLSPDAVARALDYIAADPAIWEVILTGGDPLVLAPRRLAAVLERLGDIPHVRVVRLHTRVPVVDPVRVDPALIAALRASGRTTYVAIHANHPREFGDAARAAVARLADAGFPLVSQTVLLRGINDDIATLGALMRSFVELRIKPYYLHHADLAPGTAHLRTDIETGRALMQELRGRYSGLCQPTYVLDIPGGHGKAPLGPDALASAPDGRVAVVDYHGVRHAYPPQVARKPDFAG